MEACLRDIIIQHPYSHTGVVLGCVWPFLSDHVVIFFNAKYESQGRAS